MLANNRELQSRIDAFLNRKFREYPELDDQDSTVRRSDATKRP